MATAGKFAALKERVNMVVQTPKFQCASKWTTVCLFLGAIIMTNLYIVEWKKYAEWRAALKQIRQFSYEHDPRLIGKSDKEMLVLAQNLSEQLNFWTVRIAEIEQESVDVIVKIELGWRLYGQNMYHFSTDKKSWDSARRFCLATKSDLATIMTAEEQTYLDLESKKVADAFWICMKRNASFPFQVKWCQKGITATRTYWNTGQPDGNMGDCVASVHQCAVHQCWDDYPCSDKLRYLCKKGPDPRFEI